MRNIIIAERNTNHQEIHRLTTHYRTWLALTVNDLYLSNLTAAELIEHDLRTLDDCMPPMGRTVLVSFYDNLAGIGLLRCINNQIAEIRYIFVCGEYRSIGLGCALLLTLIQEARHIGYSTLRVSCAKFMTVAQHLFKSYGFTPIKPYEDTEIPLDQHANWIFLEKTLTR